MGSPLLSRSASATPHGDEGYFPRGRSMLRRVMGERAVGLIYGQRALMIGALDPRNYVGTALSTGSAKRPYARLAHTAKAFETIYFGSRAEADRMLGLIHGMHRTVKGTLPEDAGRYPAGTPYSAYDPDLMLWTIAVNADSALELYETLVRRLTDHEREELWQDFVLLGELFGLDRSHAPATYPDFCDYWHARLHSDTLYLTDGAREGGLRSAFGVPVPTFGWPGMQVAELVIAGTLPERVRDLYGISWSPVQQAAHVVAVQGIRRSRRLVPHRVRRGGNTKLFDMVTAAERGLVQAGRQRWVLRP
ncbi:MAG: oxygenase MpaB family protein [Solirubrobacterales bacterium]